MKTAFLLIVGGGIGNLIDRIFNGYVVDFIERVVSLAFQPACRKEFDGLVYENQ